MPQTANKRERERARQQKRVDKAQSRAARKKDKETRPTGPPGEDPDLAGIVAGPQPIRDDD